jgi:NAD(P)H-hydrate epimerase
MARLAGTTTDQVQADRTGIAASFAAEYGALVVLKGSETIVSGGEIIYVNRSGNPGMATAGAGDVLTGVIAGLVAQGLGAFQASQLGVYLHGLAGDTAGEAMTQYCVTATDILDFLPEAFRARAGSSDG